LAVAVLVGRRRCVQEPKVVPKLVAADEGDALCVPSIAPRVAQAKIWIAAAHHRHTGPGEFNRTTGKEYLPEGKGPWVYVWVLFLKITPNL